MKEIKFKVSVSTMYVGSLVSDEISVNVPEDATEDEIEEIVGEEAKEWLWENINFGYSINPNP